LRVRIARGAAPHGGVIARRRLLANGVTARMIERMLARGDLYELFPGVYAVGRPEVSAYGLAWAAVHATRGRGKTPRVRGLARRSAAAALRIGAFPAAPEIVVVGKALVVEGIDIAGTRSLEPDEIWRDANKQPCTSWARTLTDLAPGSSVSELEDYLERSERRGLLKLDVLDAAIARAHGRDGLRKLQRALEPYRGLPETEYLSLLERLANKIMLAAQIAQPEVNAKVVLPDGARIRVDLLFREQRLAVEVDGRDTHQRARQFQTDRWRDRELQKLGYTVLRFTWQDVTRRPQRVVADILAFLNASL
jgi:hypothetical protein